ncbi:hypothetical protein [Ruthenibacterium lactatiformans]
MKEAVRFAHAHGVRVHVTVNTMPRNDEVAWRGLSGDVGGVWS